VPDQRSLVFVGAHPDDETFGLGGTLARYALDGVNVVYACATRGEAGSADPEYLSGHASPGDMRWHELMCAGQILGLAEVVHLGFRDSGMPGSADNQHPDALVNAPIEAVAGRIVQVLRKHRPQVVITFDPIGGYRHPDHIAIQQATVRAFHAAGDPAQFVGMGQPWQPQKLYYIVFPRQFLRLAVRVLPLFRRDPRRYGRNQDIDLVSLTSEDFPTHARINVWGEPARRRNAASDCHRSQLSGDTGTKGPFGLLRRLFEPAEPFMRAYPPVNAGRLRETDLFEGVS
jgi:LmbE family N-acetylglucosaminyl deacetylase